MGEASPEETRYPVVTENGDGAPPVLSRSRRPPSR